MLYIFWDSVVAYCQAAFSTALSVLVWRAKEQHNSYLGLALAYLMRLSGFLRGIDPTNSSLRAAVADIHAGVVPPALVLPGFSSKLDEFLTQINQVHSHLVDLIATFDSQMTLPPTVCCFPQVILDFSSHFAFCSITGPAPAFVQAHRFCAGRSCSRRFIEQGY
jgi:hypothetical protein